LSFNRRLEKEWLLRKIRFPWGVRLWAMLAYRLPFSGAVIKKAFITLRYVGGKK